MRRTLWLLTLACSFAVASASVHEASAGAERPAARAGKSKVRGKKASGRQVSAQSKKALGDLMATYRFGMSRDEVIKAINHQLEAKYREKLEATTDVYAQDQLRKEQRKELRRSWV